MGTPETERATTASPSRTPLRRALRLVMAVEIGVAGLSAALIFVLVLVQAGQRFLPIDGWTWTGELARYGLVWVTFTAAGVLVTRDGHIALQLVDELRPELLVRLIRVLALLVVAAVGVGFAVACWSLIQESGSLTTPALGLPMRWVYILPLVGFTSTAVRAAVGAVVVGARGVAAADQSAELDVQVNGPLDKGAPA